LLPAPDEETSQTEPIGENKSQVFLTPRVTISIT
jgi:hypothetical protein